MAANNELNNAMEEVESALRQLPHAQKRVRVVGTDMGHIHAFVGSDRFQNLGPGERQENVWAHLRENVASKALGFLYRVEPMNIDEFTEFIREVQLRALSPNVTDASED